MSEQNLHSTFGRPEFERLFKLHFGYLCGFAQQYVHDMDTAQDICQKVFIALWEKRTEINPNQSIKSYLFTSVKNRCLNFIRDNKKYRSKVLDLDCGDFEIAASDNDSFAVEDLKSEIEKALNTLPEKCRLVFEMSRYEDKKYKEIAEELAVSQKTVEAHMSKALKVLRVALKGFIIMLLLLLFR